MFGYKPTVTDQGISEQNFLRNLMSIQALNGSLNIVGDSISQGSGASVPNNAYASKLFSRVISLLGLTDYETITNFTGISDFSYSGSTSYGTLGPCKKSLIMQPGSSITFTRACAYVDIIYNQTPTSGELQIAKNGTVYKTLNLAGTTTSNACTFPSTTTDPSSGTYTITCINASVEIIGVICLNANSNGTVHCNRMALSGTATSDYTDTPTLQSILSIGTFYQSLRNIFIIPLMTNDIYNASKAVSSTQFKTNLRTIAKYLLDAGQIVILYVCEKPNETSWPPIIEPHVNYKQKVYELSRELGLSVIDLSTIDFVANNLLYTDKVHPNDMGHEKYKQEFINALGKKFNYYESAKVLVTMSTAPSIPNAVFTALSFDTEEINVDNIHSITTNPTRLTANTAGFYNIFASVDFQPNATGGRVLSIKLNGTTWIGGQQYTNALSGGLDTSLSTSTCYYLNQGDYVEAYVYQTSGGSLSLNASNPCDAGMVKVG